MQGSCPCALPLRCLQPAQSTDFAAHTTMLGCCIGYLFRACSYNCVWWATSLQVLYYVRHPCGQATTHCQGNLHCASDSQSQLPPRPLPLALVHTTQLLQCLSLQKRWPTANTCHGAVHSANQGGQGFHQADVCLQTTNQPQHKSTSPATRWRLTRNCQDLLLSCLWMAVLPPSSVLILCRRL
jgi:hypothetical protein